jgi:23S rRNA pseudouridine2605 synthase
VGRLDYNTEGLLIVCNSGDLTNRMMHPRFGLEREYAVRILGDLSDELQTNLRTGVQLEDGVAKFLELSDLGGEGANKWYKVVLTEGKNREVRRLFEAVGVVVSRLIRTRFGPVYLPSRLKRGQLQELDDATSAQLMVTLGVWKDPDAVSTGEVVNNVPRHQPKGRRNQRIETQRLQSGQTPSVNTGRGGERRNRGNKTTQTRLQPSYPSQAVNYGMSNTTQHNQAAFLEGDRQPASYGGALYTPESGAAGHVDLLAHSWASPAKVSTNRPRRTENRTGQVDTRRASIGRKPDPMQTSANSLSSRAGQRVNPNGTKPSTRTPRSRKPMLSATDSILGGMTENASVRKSRTVKFDTMTGEGSSRIGRLTGQSLTKRPSAPAPVVTILKKRKLISEESQD